MYLSITLFDPALIHSGLDDRCVDALVETCAAFTADGLLETCDGGLVPQQNLEVTQYFKRRWTAVQDEVPVNEYVFSMWMSYPHWERCLQLKRVLELVTGLTFTSSYPIDFVGESNTALDADTLCSSLHLVRIWFRHSFNGQPRRKLQGLLRLTESTDMLVWRLVDEVRAKQWDQLLMFGLD